MDEPKGLQSGAEGTVEVEFRDTVAVLYMKCGENRINRSFADKMNAAMDKVESNGNIRALVTTGDPASKFYSNGIDLNWMLYQGQSEEGMKYRQSDFLPDLTAMWCRVLTYPLPTVAAINGHAFAGGAILALCNDYQVMRKDKGWWSVNEIFLGMLFPPYLQELLRTKLPADTLRDAAVFGRKYTGPEALQSKVVHQVCEGPDVVQHAVNLAKQLTAKQEYDRNNLHQMKEDIYNSILSAGLKSRI